MAAAGPLSADGFHLPTGRLATRRAAPRTGLWRRLTNRHPANRGWRTALPLALITAFAALTGAFAYNVLTDGGLKSRGGPSLLPDLDTITTALGFGLEQATLTGQRYTSDSDVFDALQLGRAHSLLRFDAVAARERVERLPWVASVSITRVFPGRVDVHITERTPFALWQQGDRHILVDRGGRELSAADPRDYASLPRLTGAGAPGEAAALLDLVGRYPLVASRLVSAERVDGRRWTLHLSGRVALELPADREALALDHVAQGNNIARLVAAGGRIIDLRSPGRIAVRQAPPPPRGATTAAAGGN